MVPLDTDRVWFLKDMFTHGCDIASVVTKTLNGGAGFTTAKTKLCGFTR